jgi:hypothetical protein
VTVTIETSSPTMALDAPAHGSTVGPTFTVSGWAVDRGAPSGTGVDTVHVWAFPQSGSPMFLGVASYGGSRPDVGALFGSQFTSSAFSVTASDLSPGAYTVVAYAHSTVTGTFNQSRTATVTVSAPVSDPLMAIDVPANGSTAGGSFQIAGWALDRAAASGPGVDLIHVWAFPAAGDAVFVGAAAYGQARPDVAAFFGDSRFTDTGYSHTANLPAGQYTLAVYARSTVTGTFNQVRTVTVTVP